MRLEAHGLAFGYPEHPVGRDVSLRLDAGEVLCLLGPNGCGKTTLFKTLLGLLPAQDGRIDIGGDELSALDRREVARRIAYVPQATSGLFPYSAFDVVLMGRVSHRGMFAAPTLDDRKVALAAMAELGIVELASRDVTKLSGGQRQLVIAARALAQGAPLIVMDEPTASLDFGNQATVLSQMRRLAARGSGILLSTHDPDHAFAVADRILLMREGAVVASGPPNETLTAANLKRVYDVDVSVETLSDGRKVAAPRLTTAT